MPLQQETGIFVFAEFKQIQFLGVNCALSSFLYWSDRIANYTLYSLNLYSTFLNILASLSPSRHTPTLYMSIFMPFQLLGDTKLKLGFMLYEPLVISPANTILIKLDQIQSYYTAMNMTRHHFVYLTIIWAREYKYVRKMNGSPFFSVSVNYYNACANTFQLCINIAIGIQRCHIFGRRQDKCTFLGGRLQEGWLSCLPDEYITEGRHCHWCAMG